MIDINRTRPAADVSPTLTMSIWKVGEHLWHGRTAGSPPIEAWGGTYCDVVIRLMVAVGRLDDVPPFVPVEQTSHAHTAADAHTFETA